jgi:hypothetical protein
MLAGEGVAVSALYFCRDILVVRLNRCKCGTVMGRVVSCPAI